jgi:transposase
MFLQCRTRKKDGKIHRSWSIEETRRLGKRVVHRHVLYLGELNDSQRRAWERTLSVLDKTSGKLRQMSLFPDDLPPLPPLPPPPPASPLAPLAPRIPLEGVAIAEHEQVRVRLWHLRLDPRQWGACYLANTLYEQPRLDEFFSARLPKSRKGTDWEKVLRILVIYRLLAPGSEWKLHRQWFRATALRDLLDVDETAAQDDTLYRCHDLLLAHKEDLFQHLRQRWTDLFNARYDILLYDLTSTYFECDASGPSNDETDPRKFGYSRDRRGDCVQVIIALIVTPEGLPLAYEMLPGNTSDKTTLESMLALIQKRHGQTRRVWVMDRGIPTEKTLQLMRESDPPIHYLVGTPKARLTRYEAALSEQPWTNVREHLRVKKPRHENETCIHTESKERVHKERSMRRRSLKTYWKRLGEIATLARPIPRDEMLMRLGKAQEKAGKHAASLVAVEVTPEGKLTYRLDKPKLREALRREGRYLLRTNLADETPDTLWLYYMQLVFVEEAFRTLKGDLALRPVYHQLPGRIEAHLFIAFLAYCLSITLRQQLKAHAAGLMPRSVFEKLATIQLLDVRIPTTDGRELLLERRSEPDKDAQLVLGLLNLELPGQAPPKIYYPLSGKGS